MYIILLILALASYATAFAWLLILTRRLVALVARQRSTLTGSTLPPVFAPSCPRSVMPLRGVGQGGAACIS